MNVLLAAGVSGIVMTAILLLVWPRHGKFGINLSSVRCPQCALQMPMIRRPTSERQSLWGGWTCQRCGCEMDKYGKALVPEGEAC